MPKKASSTPAQDAAVKEFVYQSEADIAVERRLEALHMLQCIHSEIDKIQTIRGELPQAIEDLENEITGLNTRIENQESEIATINEKILGEKRIIAESKDRIKVIKEQQATAKNNRIYETLEKELENRELDVQLGERHIHEADAEIKYIEGHILKEAREQIAEKSTLLKQKQDELGDIITETEQEEARLTELSKAQEEHIEERYLTAYKRIRNAAHNGLAVVKIDREACGGCFNKIPPQRQMEIKMHKKVIVCEYCGRIIVDDSIVNHTIEQFEQMKKQ